MLPALPPKGQLPKDVLWIVSLLQVTSGAFQLHGFISGGIKLVLDEKSSCIQHNTCLNTVLQIEKLTFLFIFYVYKYFPSEISKIGVLYVVWMLCMF